MQAQKIFFSSLLVLGIAVSGYFSFRAAIGLIDFFTFKEQAAARILRWEVKETKGKYPITAYYSFESKERVWQGVTRFGEPWHLNEASAVKAIREKAKENWTVWFNPGAPSHSSLERAFPTSLVIRTLICYGVVVYFVSLFRKFIRNICN